MLNTLNISPKVSDEKTAVGTEIESEEKKDMLREKEEDVKI